MQILKCASESGHLQSLDEADESYTDWTTSAANLATLSMNFEILRKNCQSDMNLVTGITGNQAAQGEEN